MEKPLYSIFAFIEIFTVIYVWGELQFPAVYCGKIRPLSLYYYPMAMSLLDLVKLNMYVSTRHIQNKQYRNSIAILNFELFITNTWVTFLLAILFSYQLCLYICCLPVVLFKSIQNSQSVTVTVPDMSIEKEKDQNINSNTMINTITNPICITNITNTNPIHDHIDIPGETVSNSNSNSNDISAYSAYSINNNLNRHLNNSISSSIDMTTRNTELTHCNWKDKENESKHININE